MSRHLLALIAPPGSGKSTVADALTAGVACETSRWGETSLWLHEYQSHDRVVYEPGKSEAGTAKGKAHRGTDLLQHNVQRYAEPWLCEQLPEMVFQEGCQVLASRTWLDLAEKLGYRIQVVYIAVPEALRKKRVEARGYSEWNESWQQGLHTRTLRLAAEYAAVMVPGEWEPLRIAQRIAEFSPVARTLLNAPRVPVPQPQTMMAL